MRFGLAGAALLFLNSFSVAAAGGAEVLICDLDRGKPTTYIRETVVIALEEGSKSAIVADDTVMHYMKRPVRAAVKNKRGKLQITWEVRNVTNAAHQKTFRMRYMAELNPKTGKIHFSIRPQGYATNMTSLGTCKPLKNRSGWERLLRKMS